MIVTKHNKVDSHQSKSPHSEWDLNETLLIDLLRIEIESQGFSVINQCFSWTLFSILLWTITAQNYRVACGKREMLACHNEYNKNKTWQIKHDRYTINERRFDLRSLERLTLPLMFRLRYHALNASQNANGIGHLILSWKLPHKFEQLLYCFLIGPISTKLEKSSNISDSYRAITTISCSESLSL